MQKLSTFFILSSRKYLVAVGNSALSEIFMLLILAFIMFGVGLTLSLKDFRSVFIHPRALIAGLFAQMILLPVIAFAVAEICSLSPELKTGLIIISVCPGGATSNLITYLLKGDAALAVSLTITNSILILFSIPAVIFLALSHYMLQEKFIELPIASTVLNIFLMAILPVAIGVMIRNRRPVLAKNVERPMKYIMPALLGIIFLIAAMQENPETEQTSADLIISVLPWVAILNLGAMFAGYFTARVMKLGKDRQISLAVEVGIQNSALAITIASNPLFLGNAIMAVPALAYGLITFITAIIFGILINKNIL